MIASVADWIALASSVGMGGAVAYAMIRGGVVVIDRWLTFRERSTVTLARKDEALVPQLLTAHAAERTAWSETIARLDREISALRVRVAEVEAREDECRRETQDLREQIARMGFTPPSSTAAA